MDDALAGVSLATDGVVNDDFDAYDKRAGVNNAGVDDGDLPRLREAGVSVVNCVAAPSWRGVDNVGATLRDPRNNVPSCLDAV